MSDAEIEGLLAEVRGVLKGISDEETSCPDGWWETSEGAKFGSERLAALEALLRERIAGAAVPQLFYLNRPGGFCTSTSFAVLAGSAEQAAAATSGHFARVLASPEYFGCKNDYRLEVEAADFESAELGQVVEF